jgi:hypothetical protein
VGLPEIVIDFKTKASTILQRSEKGIVALIIADATDSFSMKEYSKVSEVKDGWTDDNIKLIKLAFEGKPTKVIVIRIATNSPDYDDTLQKLGVMKFNYLAAPHASTEDKKKIVNWIKEARTKNKPYKAVLANEAVNYEGIINFTTDKIKTSDKTYSTDEYTVCIAGILAGLPLDRSATYFVLPNITSVEEKVDPNANINNGELVIINDGEKNKLARGVNSLKTINVSDKKSADMKKIKIVEGMDLILEDIISNFNNNYVGKVINNYDNKQLFLASVNNYFLQLVKDSVLDKDVKNQASIDIETHISLLEKKGVDVSSLSEIDIKKTNTGSKVYATATIKFLDAMEDLQFIINM